jgi:hypothetical protein
MTASRTVLQTLIDEFGKACAAHDTEKVLWARRTLDAKIDELLRNSPAPLPPRPGPRPPFPSTQPNWPQRPSPAPPPPFSRPYSKSRPSPPKKDDLT